MSQKLPRVVQTVTRVESIPSTEAVGGGGGTSYATAVLADSPVGFWKLDEPSGTTATDSASAPHNGSYEGTFTLAQAGPFAGVNSVSLGGGDIRIAHNAAFSIVGALTLECWVYPTAYSTNMMITKCLSNSGSYELRFNTTTVKMLDNVGGQFSSIYLPALNTWSHLAFAKDSQSGTHWSVYINGEFAGGGTAPGNANGNSSDVLIGARDDATTPFAGKMYGVAIYNTRLSTIRIAAHAACTTP